MLREIYKVVDGKWIEDPEISHRKMSNNSVLYTHRPSWNVLKKSLTQLK